MSPWIVNTSPLLYLAKLDRLDLLKRAAPQLIIPPAVLAEVREHRDEAAAKIEEACSAWLSVVPVKRRGKVEILQLELGPGETEVLILSQELGADRVVLGSRGTPLGTASGD